MTPPHLARSALACFLSAALACGDSDDDPTGPEDDGGEVPAAGCSDGELAGGALYRVCFPASWNGDLVVYAHGYVRPDEPLAIRDDAVDGTPVSALVNALGYAFATTSYRANGLVADVAVDDLAELDALVRDRYRPDPARTFLVGVSEGGLVAALALERSPELYAGALAACGPIGDFALQVDHVGDFRAVFDYLFPGVLPGSPVDAPPTLQQDWETVHVPAILDALAGDPVATLELLSVTDLPVDPGRLASVGESVVGLLWYNAFATNDARERLGGQPYENIGRTYEGSADDAALNADIARFAADAGARSEIARFQTTGQLTAPMVTLHTTGDPVVPVEHQALHAAKVAAAGADGLLEQDTYDRYGHCAFEQPELLLAFSSLVERATPATRVAARY